MQLPIKSKAKSASLIRIPLVALNRERAGLRHGVRSFRLALEAELERRGPMTVFAASRVHTALTALRRHLRVEKVLTTYGDKLTHEQWLAYADRSVRFKETVDRCLASLGLDRDAEQDLHPWTIPPSDNGSCHEPVTTRQAQTSATETASTADPESFEAFLADTDARRRAESEDAG
jgi:hypothetical protein